MVPIVSEEERLDARPDGTAPFAQWISKLRPHVTLRTECSWQAIAKAEAVAARMLVVLRERPIGPAGDACSSRKRSSEDCGGPSLGAGYGRGALIWSEAAGAAAFDGPAGALLPESRVGRC
jgi:hypothetical protein